MTFRLLDITLVMRSLTKQLHLTTTHIGNRYLVRGIKIIFKALALMASKDKQRQQLKSLTDTQLHDLGLTREQAEIEAKRFFWE